MRIGIFGGSFNPIHLGHLILAETARDTLALDRVVFIPSAKPPHKSSRGLLPAAVRMELVQRAIQGQPAFVVSDIELQRPGTSYSIETVRIVRQQLPMATLFLLVGQDLLQVRWAHWDQIKRLCTVVVATRAGVSVARRQPGIRQLSMPLIEISSSDIRARCRGGRSIRFLVPSAVERYIADHHLYPPRGR